MAQQTFKDTKINVEFDEATSRQQLNSGDNISTLFGKIKKIFSDLKSVCFSGSYKDLNDTPTTATADTDGLMSATDKTKLDSADDTYALKSKYGDTTIDVGRKADTDVGENSTAEGLNTTASGHSSHAEGGGTIASAGNCHAEGVVTIARGRGSHSEGWYTEARGHSSHAEGYYTIATKTAEHASGQYNQSNSDTLFSVGDGTADNARHNAFEITTTGGKLHDEEIMTQNKVSNPNLLINPDFKINQRGKSGTIIPNKNSDGNDIHTYFVDRWGVDSGSITINSDGTLTLNGTISQILENTVGTDVTASVSAGMASYDDSTKTFTITGNGVTISWAKLEIGSTPTPFSPPDTATELMKCKRYYQRISGAYRQIANGYIQAANIVMTTTPLQQMRINGVTGKFVGTAYIWYKNHIAGGGAVSTTIITPINLSQNLATLGFNLNSAVDASYIGLPCLVQLRDYDSYIEFDAEL